MRKSFCIVCVANYCRSPVVENLLKKRFEDNYEFFSAGITPISQPSMDPRSLKFLNENNANYNFHIPKRINKKMLDYFDKFIAVDLFVLNELNTKYPKYRQKFLSLTMHFSDINIIDPYRLQQDEYNKIMNHIKYIVENINLENLQ
jgi:protein-tyrosine-phosphatase